MEIETINCIDIIDDKQVEIELRKDIGLYYTEDDKNYTFRYDFKEIYDNDIKNYMLFTYDLVNLDQFDENDIKLMKNNEYEGKYVYKIVLDDGSVFNHYYSYIGMEEDNDLKLIPIKISKKNKFNIDPRRAISTSWYYLETEDQDFIELTEIIKEVENIEDY